MSSGIIDEDTIFFRRLRLETKAIEEDFEARSDTMRINAVALLWIDRQP